MGSLLPAIRGGRAKTRKAIPRWARILELRNRGWTFERIGQELGMTGPGAYKGYQRALELTIQQPADELRETWHQRHEGWLEKLDWKLETGDCAAIDRALRISQADRDLLGLDAPRKTELTGAAGGPVEIRIVYDDGNPGQAEAET